mmetsp:Transcript_61462/g.173334  ORF Transcript_61462/g.173334 Transcript_61462/m.173334 type:complete len:224 (+) Transcript_61462:418-1089(+)
MAACPSSPTRRNWSSFRPRSTLSFESCIAPNPSFSEICWWGFSRTARSEWIASSSLVLGPRATRTWPPGCRADAVDTMSVPVTNSAVAPPPLHAPPSLTTWEFARSRSGTRHSAAPAGPSGPVDRRSRAARARPWHARYSHSASSASGARGSWDGNCSASWASASRRASIFWRVEHRSRCTDDSIPQRATVSWSHRSADALPRAAAAAATAAPGGPAARQNPP